MKDLKLRIADRQLTAFSNPYPQMDGVTKEKIKYKRADGVDLTGDLYLPKDIIKTRDGKLPVLIWPTLLNIILQQMQHRFAAVNTALLLSAAVPVVMYVTQGYAVFNNAEMPS